MKHIYMIDILKLRSKNNEKEVQLKYCFLSFLNIDAFSFLFRSTCSLDIKIVISMP